MSNGFVLLAVLVFLQIFSLLSMYELSSVSTAIKSNQQSWRRELLLASAENELYDLEQELLGAKPDCVRPVISASELLNKSPDWWQEYACFTSSQSKTYYYFTELLGLDPCVIIDKADTIQEVTAYYYRITLLSAYNELRSPKILLQSTVVKASDEKNFCPDKVRSVVSGVQVRREL